MGWIKDKGNKPIFKEGGKVDKYAKATPKARENLGKKAKWLMDALSGGALSRIEYAKKLRKKREKGTEIKSRTKK